MQDDRYDRPPSHPEIAELVQPDPEPFDEVEWARRYAELVAYKQRVKRRRRKLGWNGFALRKMTIPKLHARFPTRNST